MKRYNESAKIEADILKDVLDHGGDKHGIVYMKESFVTSDKEGDHVCLVFETLG